MDKRREEASFLILMSLFLAHFMSVVRSQDEKYKKIARKYGFDLSDSDIMYLKAFVASIAREEIAKVRKNYGERTKQ